jgi:hypothetical protein
MQRRDSADDLASTRHRSHERQSLLRFRRVQKLTLEPERESAACVWLLGIERNGAPR